MEVLLVERRGGLVVSAVESGSKCPGSSPGQGHCVVFLDEVLIKDWQKYTTVNAIYCNIVLPSMLQTFCRMVTSLSILQQDSPTCATCFAQHCCNMLR